MIHPCQNSSPSYPHSAKVSRIRVSVQEIASALPCLAKTEGDILASPDLSGRGNLIGHTPNTIVVRPFKVVQLPSRTRLKPRTTFLSLMVCRCGLSFRGLSHVTLSPCLCHSEPFPFLSLGALPFYHCEHPSGRGNLRDWFGCQRQPRKDMTGDVALPLSCPTTT